MPLKDKTSIVVSTSALLGAAILFAVQRALPTKKRSIPSALRGNPYSNELALALRLALQAGENMVLHCESKGTNKEISESDLGINTKGQAEDFATAVDLCNEKLVIDAIQKFFPSHKIIGEESTGTGDLPILTDEPTWIIDPIDGTTNFASGLPLTCVSIGFCVNKRAVMGVVYAPMTDEVYMSVRGYGAYRNGVRIANKKAVKKLQDSVVNYEFGYARDAAAIKRMTTAVENVLTNGCRTSRCLGSGVLDLCYVATGRMDVVYAGVANEGWKPWDYCAANVIVEESGAVMESLIGQKPGQSFDLYSKSIVCATTRELLEETRKVVLKGL